MRFRALVICLTACLVSNAAAQTFAPRALDPAHGVDVLGRSDAERLVGKSLLAEPAGSAVFGEVHVYDEFPYIDARYVHVTSDAEWQRLLYGVPGEAPRAFGQAGEGPGEFLEPRGMAFAPDGRLFVSDRLQGRVTILQLQHGADGPRLVYVSQVDGLVQPTDVDVHDGGTPADASDDRLLISEAGAQRIALYGFDGSNAVRLSEFGKRGPLNGEFLYPRAVAVARRDGRCIDDVYVADAGSHRLVRLQMRGHDLEWRETKSLPMEATSLASDHHGNVMLAMRRLDSVWKMSPQLELLAEFTGGGDALQSPRDVAIPFAWVHDHRVANSAPRWRGQGSALVLEAWREHSGVRLVDLGVEIASMRRASDAELELKLSDAAQLSLAIETLDGGMREVDLGMRAAGSQVVELPEMSDARRVTVTAKSLYDDARRDEAELALSVAPARVVLEQNYPNPFNPQTTIAFEIPRAGRATVEVFDVRGRLVQRVFDGDLNAGRHQVTWDGSDTTGRRASSGVYFYRLRSLETTAVKKMVMAQ